MRREPTQQPVVRQRGAPRPRRRWILIALALGLLAIGGVLVGRHLWARHHLRQAHAALEVGEPEQALVSLANCFEIWSDDPQLHLLAARAERMAGRAAEAARHLQAAKDAGADPQEWTLQQQLLDAGTGKLEQVEPALRRHADSGHAERRQMLDVLIRAYIARGRAAEAERDATAWIEQAPGDWQPYFLRAVARSELSHDLLSTAFDGAKRDYVRALELKPDYVPARLLLGNAYMMTGQFPDALPQLEQYTHAKPDDPKGVAELARCLRGLARVDEAQRILDAWLAERAGTLDIYLMRGQVAIDQAQPEAALKWSRKAEQLNPAAEKTQFQVAAALRALGRDDEARAYEEKWRTRRELATKLSELERTAEKEPNNVGVRHEAGVIALRLGQENAGLRWLGAALKIDPKHRPTHQVLADHFQQRGNTQAAAFHRKLAEGAP